MTTMPVMYDGRTLTFRLPEPIDRRRLLIRRLDDCRAILAPRQDVPDEMKQLIIGLFDRQAFESYSISYGNRVDIKLCMKDSQGRDLLMDSRLRYFSMHFTELSGQVLDAAWKASVEVRRQSDNKVVDGALDVVGGIMNYLGQPARNIDLIIWGSDW